jgi:hypothetical protein
MAEPGPRTEGTARRQGLRHRRHSARPRGQGRGPVIPPKRTRKVQRAIDGHSTRSGTSSSGASQSSSTAADWPPGTTRPPKAISPSSSSPRQDSGSGTSSTGPNRPQVRPRARTGPRRPRAARNLESVRSSAWHHAQGSTRPRRSKSRLRGLWLRLMPGITPGRRNIRCIETVIP